MTSPNNRLQHTPKGARTHPPGLLRRVVRLQRMKRYAHILMAAFLTLWPSLVWANGLIPAVNAYRNTPAFWFVFTVVVLIESVCVRLWLRPIHMASALWRVLVLNAVSSFAGYLLMRSPLRPGFMYVWQQAIPLFFLTVCVELPLLLLFFRRSAASRRSKLLLGIGVNVMSYAFLILAEGPVESVWLDRLRAADRRVLEQWVDTEMLSDAPGLIYGTESGPGLPHRLRYFDPREQAWHSMRDCPPIDPRYWDIEGDVVAFKHYQEEGYSYRDVTVRRLPSFDVLAEISVTNAVNSQSGWGLQVSPDRTKLAVLVPLHEISAPLRGSSYRCFGMTSELVVYDITTGTSVGTCPRKAFRGSLCWLPDSQGILFSSLRDEDLNDLTMLGKDWKRKYPDADKQFSDAPTYAYYLKSNSVEYFGEMTSVHLAAQAGRLAYATGTDTICLLDPTTGKTNTVHVGRLGYRGITISPDGRLAVAHCTLTHPLAYLGYPTIVDLADPERRHYIEGFDYRLDWTTDGESRTRRLQHTP